MLIRLTQWFVCCALLGISPGLIHGQVDKDTPEGQRADDEIPAGDKLAQERRELQRKVAEIKRRVAELRAANQLDEAAEVERDAKSLFLELQSEPVRHPQDAIRQKIEALREVGRNEEAEELEHQLRETAERETRGRASVEEEVYRFREIPGRRELAVRRGDRPEEAGPAHLERRLNHLREAAENLMAAGLPEQAEQLRRQAETMRARFGEHLDRRPELQELHNQLRQQNERIERLEQMVRKLAERIERQDEANSKGEEDK